MDSDPVVQRRRPALTCWSILLATFVVGFAGSFPGARLAAGQPPPPVQADGISGTALAQINALLSEKAFQTSAQQKIDSHLIYAQRTAAGQAIAPGLETLTLNLPYTADNRVILDVRAEVSDDLLDQLRALGAEIVEANVTYRHVRLQVALAQVESIAALPEVIFVQPTQDAMLMAFGVTAGGQPTGWGGGRGIPKARERLERAAIVAGVQRALNFQGSVTNVGRATSEGDVAHRADFARTKYGADGTGVKIGVLSSGVDGLATAQASQDLGVVTVLPGQAGSGNEGTAMLEIIHDLAPGAQLYFATGFTSNASFASNILALRNVYHCDIIVDDVLYYAESPFQDGQTQAVVSLTNAGIVAQAVKDVVANGALYFSSAGNSGNLDGSTSGTWEGDFVDGGAVTYPETGRVHRFGATTYDLMTADSLFITLFWADPLGASANDYDLFRLNSSGTAILDFSTNVQNGAQDPFEYLSGAAVGDRIIIVKYSGYDRFLHLDTNRGRLSVATAGNTHGHATTTAANSFSVAATPATTPGPYPNPFNSSDQVESFSSDGPRRIFFHGDSTAITVGNFLATGGQVLTKPDITAADGVSVSGAGYSGPPLNAIRSPFYGTSAAAPHAAAIAALVKSADPSLTASQIRSALIASAMDIQATGTDRNSGAGIIMADTAISVPAPTISLISPASGSNTGSVSVVIFGTSFLTGMTAKLTKPGSADIVGTNAQTVSATQLNCTFNLSGAAVGSWTVVVAHDVETGGLTGSLVGGFTVSVPGAAVTITGLSANVTFPTAPGTTITWTTTTTGGTAPLQYRYWLYRPFSWVIVRDFSSSNAWTWTPSEPGQYKVQVWVRNAGSTSDYDAVSYTGYFNIANAPMATEPGFDRDGKADLAVWRPSNGTWYVRSSSSGFSPSAASASQWGLPDDTPLSGDFDGDGLVDLAVWRPSDGMWYIRTSSTGYSVAAFLTYQWGLPGDTPIAADFDGDLKTDLTVWRPSNGTWYIRTSSTGYSVAASFTYQWGLPGDVPLATDFDGDGRTDLAVWRPSEGMWYIRTSSTGYSLAAYAMYQWGLPGDIPLSGDFDGDGETELSVWRPSNGTWYFRTSSSGYTLGAYSAYQWGLPGDVPLVADFDGDGKADLTVWRPTSGMWYVLTSGSGYAVGAYQSYQWGLPGDKPVQ